MDQINQDRCDENLLRRLVCNDLSAKQTAEVHRHLDQCAACADKLQSIAADRWSWSDVVECLPSDEYDSHVDAASLSVLGYSSSCDDVRDNESLLSREIAGWLDPTDNPQMLGRFAGYEIVGIIGHGGMGIVLKGFEASLNRYVAIKVLAPRLATSGAARKRFSREAQAAAAVRHDNVIAVHRVDEWHGLPFLVMPYVAGVSLQKRIDEEGPLSTEATLRVAAQVAAGLAAAHAQGLVHRDIKPANILLDQGVERVTITDFGLARAVDDASITRTGVVAGTPQFMSPEQAQAKALDHRSDLFSLGSLMYAMATGRPPFRGDENAEILKKIVDEPARNIRDVEPSVPDWLVEIIGWLHAKEQVARPQTADEVAELLEHWLAHIQQPNSVPEPTRLERTKNEAIGKPPSNWRRWIAAAAGGMLVVLAAVIIQLETSKGTLRIVCEADGVPVLIRKGDKVVDRLVVNRDGASLRLFADDYVVEIEGEAGDVSISDRTIVVARGEESVAEIRRVGSPQLANGTETFESPDLEIASVYKGGANVSNASPPDFSEPPVLRTPELDFAIMTERVDDYVIGMESVEDGTEFLAPFLPAEFQLQDGPILRWKNPRRATRVGATFLWTYLGRPAAIVSPYSAWDNESYIHEFQSLHTAPFVAKLDGKTVWTPSNAGIEFQPAPDSVDIANSRDARLAQMKDIARKFTASGGTPDRPRWGLPLLPEPIYRYNQASGDDGSDAPIDGAMFAFAMDGDPELLLIIEARDSRGYVVAFARMAESRLFVTHEDKVSWQVGESKPWQLRSTYRSIEYKFSDATEKPSAHLRFDDDIGYKARHLRKLALAFRNFHDVFDRFPVSANINHTELASRDPWSRNGSLKRVAWGDADPFRFSWRVALLPILDEQELYESYQFDQPWDNAHNLTLLAKMPAVFGKASEDDPAIGFTRRLGFFELDGASEKDLANGLAGTLLIAEAGYTVPWTKPQDITFRKPADLTKSLKLDGSPLIYATADGSVRAMQPVDQKRLALLAQRTLRAESRELFADDVDLTEASALVPEESVDAGGLLAPVSNFFNDPDSMFPKIDNEAARALKAQFRALNSRRLEIRALRPFGDDREDFANGQTMVQEWTAPDGLVKRFAYQRDTPALVRQDDILAFASLHRPATKEQLHNLILHLTRKASKRLADETVRMMENQPPKPLLGLLFDGKLIGVATLRKPLLMKWQDTSRMGNERTIFPIAISDGQAEGLLQYCLKSCFSSPCQGTPLAARDDGVKVRVRLIRMDYDASDSPQLYAHYSLTVANDAAEWIEVTFPDGTTTKRLLTHGENWRFLVPVISKSDQPPTGRYYIVPKQGRGDESSTVECTLTRSQDDIRPIEGFETPVIDIRVLSEDDRGGGERVIPKKADTPNGAASQWVPTAPQKVKSVKKYGAEILDDKSVQFDLATSDWQEPQLHFRFEKGIRISRVRLEILSDTRFPDRRLGRDPDASVVLFDLKPTLVQSDGIAKAIDFDRVENPMDPDDPYVSGLIDYATDTGWEVPNLGPNQDAVEVLFAFDDPIALQSTESLILHLDAGGRNTLDVPARVRVSFSTTDETESSAEKDLEPKDDKSTPTTDNFGGLQDSNDSLIGDWLETSCVWAGRQLREPDEVMWQIRSDGTSERLMLGSEVSAELLGAVRVDTTRNPAWVDFISTCDSKDDCVLQGIFRCDPQAVTIALPSRIYDRTARGINNPPRPTSFESTVENKVAVYHLVPYLRKQ